MLCLQNGRYDHADRMFNRYNVSSYQSAKEPFNSQDYWLVICTIWPFYLDKGQRTTFWYLRPRSHFLQHRWNMEKLPGGGNGLQRGENVCYLHVSISSTVVGRSSKDLAWWVCREPADFLVFPPASLCYCSWFQSFMGMTPASWKTGWISIWAEGRLDD